MNDEVFEKAQEENMSKDEAEELQELIYRRNWIRC